LESNWRWNVAEFGMSLTDWRLVARIDGTFGLLYVVKESATQWGLWRRNVPSFPNELVRFNGPFAIGAGARFPYGLSVEPD